jgi:FkbM family methyltransferase
MFVQPGRPVLDIGVGTGVLSAAYLKNGASVVHGFEPIPRHVERIPESLLRDERFVLHQVAVSDRSGPSFIQVPSSNSHAASLLKTFYEGKRKFDNEMEEIPIECVRLDDLDLPHAAFWKIDVEGAELEVLRGAEETLKRARPDALQVEIFFSDADRYRQTIDLIGSLFPYFYGFGMDEAKNIQLIPINRQTHFSRDFFRTIGRLGTPIYIATTRVLKLKPQPKS